MVKFVYVVVLALLALQDANASRSNLLINSSVKDLIQELNTLISDVSSRSSSLILELNTKFTELQQAANIPQLLVDAKQQVQQTLGQSDAKDCKDLANKRIYLLEREASVLSCRFTVDDDAVELRKQLQELVKKVENLLKEIGQDVFKCMRSGDFNKCLEEKVADVKKQLEIIEKSIQVTFDALEASVPMFTDKMSQCIDEKKQTLVDKIRELNSDLENCIKASNVLPINDDMLYTRILPNEISSVVGKFDLDAIIMELWIEVDDLLVINDQIDRLCGPKALDLVESLAKEAQNDAEQCFKINDLHDLEVCLAEIENKVIIEGRAIISGINQCIRITEMLKN